MNPRDEPWQKLVAAARRAPVAVDRSAPPGFSTRVVALALERREQSPSIFARLSLRAAAVACALAVAAVAINYSAIESTFGSDSAVAAGDDPVAEVVNLGS